MTAEKAREILKKHAAAYGDSRYEPALWVIAAMKEAAITSPLDGWKLVPVLPTPDMVEATFTSAAGESTRRVQRQHRANIYVKMLSAAPVVSTSK